MSTLCGSLALAGMTWSSGAIEDVVHFGVWIGVP